MVINSRLLGAIEYTEDSVIHIKEGLIGISAKENFILIEKEDFQPFGYLQSIDDPAFSLVVINPFLVEKGYDINIHEDDLKAIDVTDVKDFLILAIVVFSDKIENITVNLKAPIIINIHSKQGKQVIIQNFNYTVSEPLVKQSTLDTVADKQEGSK